MEVLLDDVANGRRDASEVWETMLEEFKSAHAAAQTTSESGPLLPRTRHKLQGYLDAAPELAGEIGDLDALSEQDGRALRARFGRRGIKLLPSKKQERYLNQLLDTRSLTLTEALESAGMILAGEVLNRDEASALIDHLKTLNAENRMPSAKQLRKIAQLAKKKGLDEARACALVGLTSYVSRSCQSVTRSSRGARKEPGFCSPGTANGRPGSGGVGFRTAPYGGSCGEN